MMGGTYIVLNELNNTPIDSMTTAGAVVIIVVMVVGFVVISGVIWWGWRGK